MACVPPSRSYAGGYNSCIHFYNIVLSFDNEQFVMKNKVIGRIPSVLYQMSLINVM